MMIETLTYASQLYTVVEPAPVPPAEGGNPFEGLSPDFLALGGTFTAWWQQLFVALWGICIIIAGVFLALGITAMAHSGDDDPRAHKKGQKKAMSAGIALALLAGFAIIVGAILAVA